MAQLDRSRPFGTIFNDDEGRFFEQDGKFFGVRGEPWVPPAGEEEVAAPAPVKAHKPKAHKAAAPVPAPSAVDAQLDAQLGDTAA